MTNAEVLVTGGSGFLGRALTAALRERGACVHAIGSSHGDIARCELPFPGVGHVYHLAARSFVPGSWQSPQAFYETNVQGTVNVLEFCRRSGASLTLVSSYVYGSPQKLPIAEDHPLQAFNPYSHTKILAEECAAFYAQKMGVRVTVVRPFNLYGPGQDSRFLIPTLLNQALDPAAETIEVADERPRRDYIHLDDVVSLMLLLGESGGDGAYNAGSGSSASIRDLVEIVNRATGRPKTLVSRGESRPGEVMDVVADITRARGLGWEPRISLEDGITRLVRNPA